MGKEKDCSMHTGGEGKQAPTLSEESAEPLWCRSGVREEEKAIPSLSGIGSPVCSFAEMKLKNCFQRTRMTAEFSKQCCQHKEISLYYMCTHRIALSASSMCLKDASGSSCLTNEDTEAKVDYVSAKAP